MNKEKEQLEASVLGRFICMEALIFIMGIISLGYGIMNGTPIHMFWGCTILFGSVVLYFVKKKDWKKHWEEQEAIAKRLEELRQQDKEGRK